MVPSHFISNVRSDLGFDWGSVVPACCEDITQCRQVIGLKEVSCKLHKVGCDLAAGSAGVAIGAASVASFHLNVRM